MTNVAVNISMHAPAFFASDLAETRIIDYLSFPKEDFEHNPRGMLAVFKLSLFNQIVYSYEGENVKEEELSVYPAIVFLAENESILNEIMGFDESNDFQRVQIQANGCVMRYTKDAMTLDIVRCIYYIKFVARTLIAISKIQSSSERENYLKQFTGKSDVANMKGKEAVRLLYDYICFGVFNGNVLHNGGLEKAKQMWLKYKNDDLGLLTHLRKRKDAVDNRITFSPSQKLLQFLRNGIEEAYNAGPRNTSRLPAGSPTDEELSYEFSKRFSRLLRTFVNEHALKREDHCVLGNKTFHNKLTPHFQHLLKSRFNILPEQEDDFFTLLFNEFFEYINSFPKTMEWGKIVTVDDQMIISHIALKQISQE